MARRCSVCAHPERERIDREFARGKGTVVLGRQYGLTKDALRNHRERHLLYLLDPSLGLEEKDLSGLRVIQTTATQKTVRKGV